MLSFFIFFIITKLKFNFEKYSNKKKPTLIKSLKNDNIVFKLLIINFQIYMISTIMYLRCLDLEKDFFDIFKKFSKNKINLPKVVFNM